MVISAALWFAAPATADPTTDAVCTAFRLGESPEQIMEQLQRNDGRFTYWRARDATVWPIIDGECD